MFQLSYLKLLATVFFALFVLSACGGGGGGAAAPAAAVVTCDANEFNDNGTCVAAINPSTCTTNQHVVNNVCTNYTAETCTEFFNSSDECVTDNYTMLTDSHFATNEYSQSGALAPVNAVSAYLNIEALIDEDNNSGAITQAGAGQIVSVVAQYGFSTIHQEFGADGAAFDSVHIASGSGNTATSTSYTSDAIIAGGNCGGDTCDGTRYAALIAGRKTGTGVHGIAYNAQLKAIHGLRTQLEAVIALGVGADIVAMNHTWNDSSVVACKAGSSSGAGYSRPEGHSNGIMTGGNLGDCSTGTVKASNDTLDATELAKWITAVDPTGTNKTIMVFGSGYRGFNSENGLSNSATSSITLTGSVEAANLPAYRAAYPVLHTDDSHDNGTSVDTSDDFSGDFTSDRWLVVTGVDSSDKILPDANGCGVAMGFCLAAPGVAYVADYGTAEYTSGAAEASYASSTVAGGLALLKGAFPNATPEQLTRLVLETSDYIALDNALDGTQVAVAGMTEDEAYRKAVCKSDTDSSMIQVETTCSAGFSHKTAPDGATLLYVNPVYGYGKLNLDTATKPGALSYVSTSNNGSIGALWQDTKLTLSSHFGGNFESVTFGIGDAYGRHFITNAPQTTSAPVAVSLDDYMANMLADNVQTQKIGGQAQANYSNTENQSWMNLEYVSGKATTKIAFQDSYKVNPLSDTGTTTILRANNIRPASTNIGMMDVDYKLGNALTLSSYVARGEYDTGYKFDELGTDFDVNYKDSHLNIGIGNIREHGQFLGTNTSGAYALNAPSISRFTDVTYGHDLGKFNIYANYINYETDVDMLHDQFATIDGLQADQYQIGFTGKDLISKDDSLNIALITKLGVTDGALNQNSTLGYTADGAFNNASQSYDLAVSERHQQFEITYQGRLYQNADKISALRDNRFFTSIRVDSNPNHVQGASQVEVVSGINIRY